jgi:hypothetical protein
MSPLKNLLRRQKARLVYIHIGKCAGASFRQALERSYLLDIRFHAYKRVHIVAPNYNKNHRYIFVVRDPVERAVSAFNWRRKIVLENRDQVERFPGELETLQKWQSMENLASALFSNGRLTQEVVDDFNKIHHLREGIAFYLDPLLNNLRPHQIFGVVTTEHFRDDVARLLKVDFQDAIHSNSTQHESQNLSNVARANLTKFLDTEYKLLFRLRDLRPNRFNEASYKAYVQNARMQF